MSTELQSSPFLRQSTISHAKGERAFVSEIRVICGSLSIYSISATSPTATGDFEFPEDGVKIVFHHSYAPLNYGNSDISHPFDSLCLLRTSFYIFDCRLQLAVRFSASA